MALDRIHYTGPKSAADLAMRDLSQVLQEYQTLVDEELGKLRLPYRDSFIKNVVSIGGWLSARPVLSALNTALPRWLRANLLSPDAKARTTFSTRLGRVDAELVIAGHSISTVYH